MSTVTGCSSCGNIIEIRLDAPEGCPHCGSALPPDLRASLEAYVRTQRPLLLTLLMWFLAVWSAGATVALTVVALSPSPIPVNGVPTEKAAVLRLLLPPFGLGIAFSSFTAYTLWKERWWGRHAVLSLLVAVPLAGTLTGPPLEDRVANVAALLIMVMLYAGLFGWYLYGKRNVVAYYRALKAGVAVGR